MLAAIWTYGALAVFSPFTAATLRRDRLSLLREFFEEACAGLKGWERRGQTRVGTNLYPRPGASPGAGVLH